MTERFYTIRRQNYGGKIDETWFHVGFIYGLYLLGGTNVFAQEPTTGEQDFACSPDEQQVETFSGTADQSFPEFEIDGTEWRFIVQATSTAETSGSVSVRTVFDPDNPVSGSAIASVDPEFSPTETSSSSVIDGPGTFTLEVDANGAEYDILVCESQTSGGGGGGTTTGAPKTPTTPPSAPKTRHLLLPRRLHRPLRLPRLLPRLLLLLQKIRAR